MKRKTQSPVSKNEIRECQHKLIKAKQAYNAHCKALDEMPDFKVEREHESEASELITNAVALAGQLKEVVGFLESRYEDLKAQYADWEANYD